jgi:hypothetical protein
MMTSSCSKCFEHHEVMQEPKLNAESAANHVTELLSCAKDIENAFVQWKEDVKDSRSRYYELNYYTTLQLHELRNAFGVVKQDSNRSINPEVVDLLQSISPNIAVCDLHRVIDGHDEMSSKAEIELVDMSVSAQSAANHQVQLDTEMRAESSMPAVDLNTESFNHKDSSNQKASKAVVIPILSEEQLSDEQRAMLINLCEFFGYPRILVLKAFEECPKSKNYQYIIQQWCAKNEMKFTFQQAGNSSVDVYDELSSESEDEPDDCTSLRQLLLTGTT